jgi:AbrB family looped-hinge helix DNA binding protein
MLIKITTKRQVTFPAKVLEDLGVKPGDRLELRESQEGYVLSPRRIDLSKLAPLRDTLRRGKGSFNLEKIRKEAARDPSLRD